MSNKFLTLVNGVRQLVTAIATSSGAGDANKIVSTSSTGYLDVTLMPPGIGADTSTIQASEALAAGDFVNIFDSTGSARCRKADATNGRDANGFVLSAVTSGQSATVYRLGTNTSLTSLTAGETYYLSATTPGRPTTTAPSTTGHIVQELGVAFDATNLVFIDRGFVLLA